MNKGLRQEDGIERSNPHPEGVWDVRGRIFLLAALLLLILMVPARALANGGPPWASGDKAGVILPGKSSTVHVVREHLRFEVDDGLSEARVTARYELANRGAGAESLPVIFVIQDFYPGGAGASTPTVTWKGARLPVEQVGPIAGLGDDPHAQMREAWGGESRVIDPVSGEVYPYAGYGRPDDAMQYHRFELAMAPGESASLEVTYYQQSGFDKNRYTYPVYQYQYLLLPARGWASFGPLEIEIAAPRQAFFASNLGLTWQEGAYRATLPALPEENLLFSFMSRRGILFGIVQPGPYYTLLVVLTLAAAVFVALGLAQWAARSRTPALATWSGLGLALFAGLPLNGLALFLLYQLILPLHEQGYGILFIGLFAFVASVPVTLILTPLRARKLLHRLTV